jgi:sec-independent protein translocase protein TatC
MREEMSEESKDRSSSADETASNQAEEGAAPERSMGFFDHLDELRGRFLKSLYVFFFGFLLCYFLVIEPVLEFLRAPLFEILPPEEQKLYFTNLFENFLTHLKVSAYASIFLFSPFFFYQVWAFIAPGLYPHERKWVVPFVFFATLFFVGGAGFAYTVVFPVGFKFFVTYGAETDVPILTIDAYYSTVLKLLLLFGGAFELPVILVLLGVLGIIDGKTLRSNRGNAVIGITVACAMFAPPDAISMLMMMAPLLMLFEASIVVIDLLARGRSKREAKEESSGPDDPQPPVRSDDHDQGDDPLVGRSRT